MEKKKIKVALVFGGRSAEHEVSLQSAKNILEAIDKDKYEVLLIGIDKKGKWYLNEASNLLLNSNNPKLIALNKKSTQNVALITEKSKAQIISLTNQRELGYVDVVFPVLHGPYGEDGTIQGLLKLGNTPFVGAGVLASAVGMDKDVMKRLLKEANISVTDFLVYKDNEKTKISFEQIKEKLGLPFFVKPANLGSSVGVHKVHSKEEFRDSIEDVFKYDSKILVERYIKGREIECSVLGNENPIASLPGEVIPHHEFYSYKAKYIDGNGAELKIPADLSGDIVKKIQEIAIRTFQTLCCEGMARVDFFLSQDNQIYVSEINTIPGFTRISMYPKLWEASGISYKELISKLIQLALERFKKEQKFKVNVD